MAVQAAWETVEAESSCAICLADDLLLRDRAVANPCMHAFCRSCLLQWMDFKRLCPLCKSDVSSVFYNITASGEYRERLLPPLPAKESPPREAFADASRFSQWDRARGGQSHRSYRSQRTRQTAPSSNGTEPRPYYHRVAALVSAPGRRAAAEAGPSNAVVPADNAEEQDVLWRRHIYSQGLYAQPLDLGRLRVSGGSASGHRVEHWVKRELQAILQTQDVALLTSFVMGLVVSAGLTASSRREGPPTGADEGPVAALRPFLGLQAPHFWHELKCFSSTPFSLGTYDRMVNYSGRTHQAEGAGPSSSRDDYSLWRAKHSRRRVPLEETQAGAPSTTGSERRQGADGSSHGAGGGESRRSKRRREDVRCVSHERRAAAGLCLECAERQAAAEEAAAAAQIAERTAKRGRGSPTDACQSVQSQAVDPNPPDAALSSGMSVADIASLANQRLRALLASGLGLQPDNPEATSGADPPQGRSAAAPLQAAFDLCDSSDDSDVVFISTTAPRRQNAVS